MGKVKVEDCGHDPDKPGYLFFPEWCEEKIREGFRQIQCEKCGLWYFWKPAPSMEKA